MKGVGGPLVGAVYIFRDQTFLLPGSWGIERGAVDRRELHNDSTGVISEVGVLSALIYS